jgi:hypothetical protein
MEYGSDAYVRLGAAETSSNGATDASPFIFVDVETYANLGALRSVPMRYIEDERTIVIRCDGERFPVLDALLKGLPLGEFRVARLEHRIGKGHRLLCLTSRSDGAEEPTETPASWEDEVDVLARARACELRALIAWSDAIWRPTNFHFELPSGLHSDVFVRLGDAMRSPRDAHVLATWLAPELADQVGIVIDTGTMTALVSAIETLLSSHGWSLGPVSILDQYPRTDLDAIGAVVNANSGGASRVLGIISISASGRLRDRLWAAMQSQRDVLEHSSLHILLDTKRVPPSLEGIDQWLPLPGEAPLISPAVRAGRCDHCLDSRRAPCARIVGAAFRPVLPSDEILLMPDPADARANRSFWEICSEASAVGVEEQPSSSSQIFRPPRRRMNIRVRFERLVQETAFRDAITARLEEESLSSEHDLVLVPEGERALSGFDEVWAALRPLVATCDAPTVFPVDHEWTDRGLIDSVRSANEILIFGLGAVTGSTLQRGMTGVQNLRTDWQYRTRGLVVHARPANPRQWQTLSNSFAGDLTPLWLTFLPEHSPLEDELNALEDLDTKGLSSEAARLLDERKQLCNGALTADQVPLLLGASLDQRVTPHSIFGNRLGAPALYVAVASALASRFAKLEGGFAAHNARFEMPALARSYYDPLILACALRWLRPHEIAWGGDPYSAAERVISEVLARAQHTDPRWEALLVAEFALAVAQGKVPRSGAEHVGARAEALYATADEDQRPALEVALALIEKTHTFETTAE